ncbi:hypothetical protein [Oryzobacter telluris]|uniref:hypothetical protein n=1 Tax=Oryzobacter telluris TaxID=3149179 RepID=UPI00370D07DB
MSIYDNSSDADRRELLSFVSSVYDDLAWMVDMRYELFSPDLSTTEGSLDDLSEFLAWLADAWPDVYETRAELLRQMSEVPSEVLANHGLAGLDLRVKLIAWRRARLRLTRAVLEEADAEDSDEVFDDYAEHPQAPLPRPKRFRRAKRVLKWASRALGHADTILGSLAALLSQAERLKEIKETVEKVSGEVAEDLPD